MSIHSSEVINLAELIELFLSVLYVLRGNHNLLPGVIGVLPRKLSRMLILAIVPLVGLFRLREW